MIVSFHKGGSGDAEREMGLAQATQQGSGVVGTRAWYPGIYGQLTWFLDWEPQKKGKTLWNESAVHTSSPALSTPRQVQQLCSGRFVL